MALTLNVMLNQVLSQSGFLEKGTFTNSADPDDKQMVSIANRVAYEIMNYYDWNELRKTFILQLETGKDRYPLPNDWQSLVPDSSWESDGSRPAEIPVSNSSWYMYKFTAFSDGGIFRANIYGNEIEVYDSEGGSSISMAYITSMPILSSEGEAKELFTNDTDTWILDDQLLILGIQAHWQQAKLMPTYGEHFTNYMRKMGEAIARSTGGRIIGGSLSDRDWLLRRSPYTPLYLP